MIIPQVTASTHGCQNPGYLRVEFMGSLCVSHQHASHSYKGSKIRA